MLPATLVFLVRACVEHQPLVQTIPWIDVPPESVCVECLPYVPPLRPAQTEHVHRDIQKSDPVLFLYKWSQTVDL